MPDEIIPTPLSDAEYHAKTAAVLAGIESTVDRWLQDDVIDIDAHRTGELLELGFPGGSKIVLNSQPPLHELWMAARGGGYHYRYVNGHWLDREGRDFFETLSACASDQAGVPLRFPRPSDVTA
jgi:CyaY protein